VITSDSKVTRGSVHATIGFGSRSWQLTLANSSSIMGKCFLVFFSFSIHLLLGLHWTLKDATSSSCLLVSVST